MKVPIARSKANVEKGGDTMIEETFYERDELYVTSTICPYCGHEIKLQSEAAGHLVETYGCQGCRVRKHFGDNVPVSFILFWIKTNGWPQNWSEKKKHQYRKKYLH
jgi:hypothetical protein